MAAAAVTAGALAGCGGTSSSSRPASPPSAVTTPAAPGTAAPARPAASPRHDRVTGTGALGQLGDPTAHISAIETPAGLKGGFTITYPDGTFVAGSVTCLFVSGSTAYVTSQIGSSGGPRQQANHWFPGSYIIIGVQARAGLGTAGPDLLNFSPGSAADPGCGPKATAMPVFPITTGNYKIRR
jgi:hypothetical protein